MELATHAGQIMDRDALLKIYAALPMTDGSQRRRGYLPPAQKLLDNATEPYRIKTVRNKGYLFAPHARITKRPFCGPARGPLIARSGGKVITFAACCVRPRRAHSSPELVILTKSIELAVQNPIT